MPGNISNQKRKGDCKVNSIRSDAELGSIPDLHQIFSLLLINGSYQWMVSGSKQGSGQ